MDISEIQSELLRLEYPHLMPDNDPDIERYYHLRANNQSKDALTIYQNRLRPRYPDDEFRTWLLRAYRSHDPVFRTLLDRGYRMLGARVLDRIKNIILFIAEKAEAYNEKDIYSTIKAAEDILRFLSPERYEAVAGIERYHRYALALNLRGSSMAKAENLVRAYLTDSLSIVEKERRRRSAAQNAARERERQLMLKADYESYLFQKKYGYQAPLIDFSSVVFSETDLARIEIPHFSRLEDQVLAYCVKYWNLTRDQAFERVLFLYSRKYGKKNYDVYMEIRRGRAANLRDDEILASVVRILITGYYYSIQGDIYLQRNWNTIKRAMEKQAQQVRLALPAPESAPKRSVKKAPGPKIAPARQEKSAPKIAPKPAQKSLSVLAGRSALPVKADLQPAMEQKTTIIKPVASKPARPAVVKPGAKPAAPKPVAVKPAAVKPAESAAKPAAGKPPARPAVVKPAVKPAASKSVAVKPAAVKPPEPAAKPVAGKPPARPAVVKSEAKPAAPKPVAVKPAAVKPAEPAAKPAAGKPPARPVVVKPAVKPAAPKPVAVKPVAVKPAEPAAKPAAGKPPARPVVVKPAVKPAAPKPVAVKPAAVKPAGSAVTVKPAALKPDPARPVQPAVKPAAPVRPGWAERPVTQPASSWSEQPARPVQSPPPPVRPKPAPPLFGPSRPKRTKPAAPKPAEKQLFAPFVPASPPPPPRKQQLFNTSLEKARGSVSDRLKELSGRSYDVYQDRFFAKARAAIRKVLGMGRGRFFTPPEEAEDMVYGFLRTHYSNPYMNWEDSVEREKLLSMGFDLPSINRVIDECYKAL